MSDAVITPAAPVVTIDPAGPAKPPAAPAAAPPAPPDPDKDPQWIGARLERERQKVLKDLGIEDVEDGKKAIDDLKKRRDADKTYAQKATELEGKLKTTSAEKAEMAEALGAYAKTQLAALTPAQQKAVTDIAGEDAAKQLKAIAALTPTWGSAPAAPPAGAPAAPPPAAPPGDTAPRPNAPNAPPPGSPPDPKAIYAELKKTNPFIAARYAIAHGVHDT